MWDLKTIAAIVLAISLITFIALFGRLPYFRRSIVGLLYRLIWITIPSAFRLLDEQVSGGRFTGVLKRVGHYIMHENHPLILIIFLVLLLGSQSLFISSAYSRLSLLHKILVVVVCGLPYFFIYHSVMSTSSYIVSGNHSQKMLQYPYDHVLFTPGQICRTCQFPKPARSKHCSICKVCVAKHDHHCIWIMNCVGKGNYIYFLSMLLSLALLLLYGGYLTFMISRQSIRDHIGRQSEKMPTQLNWSIGMSWSQYFELWAWAVVHDVRIGGVGMLSVLTAPLAWGLLLYHLYLIWAGMTTNESSKWADLKDDIIDGLVFKSGRNSKFELSTAWPISSNQILVRCENGRPPDSPSCSNDVFAERPTWERVQELQEVDNLYDLGFWDNIVDSLSP